LSVPPDISVVVTGHEEGILIHRALRSVEVAAGLARRSGLTVECVVVLDAADATTRAVVERHAGSVRSIETAFQRPCLARNAGVDAALGRFVAFLDGDDLMSPGWLVDAYSCALVEGDSSVMHPAIVVSFGVKVGVSSHVSSSEIDLFELGERNLWTSFLFAPSALLRACPFAPAPNPTGFHEDWHWVCEVVGRGGRVVAVPETAAYYRQRQGSLMGARAEGLFLRSSLFRTAALNAGPGGATPSTSAPGASRWRDRAGMYQRGRRWALRYAWLQPLARLVREMLRQRDARRVEVSIAGWLRADLEAMHAVEPELYPDRTVAGGFRYYPRGHDLFARALRQLVLETPAGVTHALLVPWLKRGGADLEAVNYARALAALGQRPVVIVTEESESPWTRRLPPGATFIDFAGVARGLDESLRQQLLAVYLIQVGVPRLHLLNSKLFLDTAARYGAAISATADVYASVFCEDVEPSGQRVGYVVRQVPAIEQMLSGIFADNDRILRWLGSVMGVAEDRLHLHYQPTPDLPVGGRRAPRERLNVLWAGRLDRQKRPDILIEVIRACAALPITFHVYGYGLLDSAASRSDFDLPNTRFHGVYDGFESLPLADLDVYLHTAQWEGLPNVLLEAAQSGLAIVTSDVGGIPELVTDGVSGRVVSPFDDVQGYVAALEALAQRPDLRQRYVEEARAQLGRQHSWDGFLEALRQTPGYLVHSPAHASGDTE
jgi:glycosyltransferase involved in cell wall biosynthesis